MRKILIATLVVALTAVFVTPAEAGPIKRLHQAKVNLIKKVFGRN